MFVSTFLFSFALLDADFLVLVLFSRISSSQISPIHEGNVCVPALNLNVAIAPPTDISLRIDALTDTLYTCIRHYCHVIECYVMLCYQGGDACVL